MTVNPVRRVRNQTFPTAIQADLAEHLRALADLPPATTTPYLTISLDWRPSGAVPEYRPALQRFEHEANALRQMHWPRGDVFDSIGRDIERVRTFLSDELEPSTKGVFIVANAGVEVFEVFELGMPLTTRIHTGPIPALLPLARLDEDYPTWAVLLADQQQATVSLFTQARRVEMLRLQSNDYPRKQATGGWSQRRFQQRADERLMSLVRQIIDETKGYLNERNIDSLIISGDDLMTGALTRMMPDEMREVVIGTVRLDNGANEQEILNATTPLAEGAESGRELAAVRQVEESVATSGRVATGSVDVLDALATGRVQLLVMNEDFHEDGWADFDNGRYGASGRTDILSTSLEEFEAVPMTVEEEMVRQAIRTGAEIEIVHAWTPVAKPGEQIGDGGEIPRSEASTILDKYAGVAALLRYN